MSRSGSNKKDLFTLVGTLIVWQESLLEALPCSKPACNMIVLRQATTPALFDNMKREIKARQDGGWKSVRWSMVKPPKLGQMDILHGRIMAQNPKVTRL